MAGDDNDPSDPITTTDPTDDVGAATLDRFRYQAHLIARTCVAILTELGVVAVICEWHEDYVMQFANGRGELVSVKHHDGTQTHWTVKQLCDSGGLRHLFDRWRKVGEACSCRLQTNEHLRTGPGQPAELARCCLAKDEQDLRKWATTLAKEFGTGDVDEVERFLRALTIEDGLPGRDVIEPVHVQRLMPELIAGLQVTGVRADVLYDRIVNLALSASSAPGHELVLAGLADPSQLGGDRQRERVLAAKTIDRRRILDVIGQPDSGPRVLLGAAGGSAPVRTRLVKKLEAGGIGATGTRWARRLRANWERQQHAWTTELPGDGDVLEDLRARILGLARTAEGRRRRPGLTYGNEMLEEIEALISSSDIPTAWPGPLDTELLLGLVFERTEACEVFWSDEFDPDAVP